MLDFGHQARSDLSAESVLGIDVGVDAIASPADRGDVIDAAIEDSGRHWVAPQLQFTPNLLQGTYVDTVVGEDGLAANVTMVLAEDCDGDVEASVSLDFPDVPELSGTSEYVGDYDAPEIVLEQLDDDARYEGIVSPDRERIVGQFVTGNSGEFTMTRQWVAAHLWMALRAKRR